ncbi:MAG: beta-galactosidase trimerization domain-containing protein [Lachnospiraceae bacterium]|nr:beta-galactosidase trimerization domain-containing protein [Lachnospiraceae bacterium]
MNYRQVHLDFHTSEKVSGIGENFDKKQFQEALKVGYVDSITVFSKCHHGWAYHPSKANEMHPQLKFDLLKAQIEAAHEIGVKTPVYLSAGLDEKYAVKHSEHLVRNRDESTMWVKDFTAPGYHKLCLNTPYLDYLLAQIKEVCENYDADGIFLDIVNVQPCYCQTCRNQLIAEGKNPSNAADALDLAERVYANYTRRVRETIDSVKPGLPVFHNGGHIRKGRRDLAHMNTHLELESLPTGGWGYDHFPVSAAYARTLGMEFLGMTGKFHTSWGEFGGFKHPNALRYEVALSIANGAKCSIGDQLHPDGSMDMATYELIGAAYKEAEEKEAYLKGAENIVDVAVLGIEAIDNYLEGRGASQAGGSTKTAEADAGCARILLEGKYLFNYIDTREDFSNYKLLILPDGVILDEALTERLKQFVEAGGKILASGTSGTDGAGSFLLDFGCRFGGENEYRPDYCRPRFELSSLKNSAYIMYSQGYKVEEVAGEVLADRENPYFNRTIEHFSSHKHTPNNKKDIAPAMVEGKDGIYIAWNIFEDYANYGTIVDKEIVLYALDRLLADKSVKTDLPAQGIITLTRQDNRKIVHLLYASPVRRGKNTEIIEDIVPIYDTKVAVKCSEPVSRVYLAPQNEDVAYKVKDGYVTFTVDKLENHQMVVVE